LEDRVVVEEEYHVRLRSHLDIWWFLVRLVLLNYFVGLSVVYWDVAAGLYHEEMGSQVGDGIRHLSQIEWVSTEYPESPAEPHSQEQDKKISLHMNIYQLNRNILHIFLSCEGKKIIQFCPGYFVRRKPDLAHSKRRFIHFALWGIPLYGFSRIYRQGRKNGDSGMVIIRKLCPIRKGMLICKRFITEKFCFGSRKEGLDMGQEDSNISLSVWTELKIMILVCDIYAFAKLIFHK
jgi:hypothetical protein